MAIVYTAETPGMTEQQAQSMLEQVGQRLRQAKGFIAHASGPTQAGYRVVEVWQSRENFQRWFDQAIKPGLQAAGVPEPRQEFFEAPLVLTP